MNIVVAVSPDGQKRLRDEYKQLSGTQQVAVDSFLKLSKKTINDPSQGLAMYWEGITREYEQFYNLLQRIPSYQYYSIFLDDNDPPIFCGEWSKNPFGIHTQISCNFYDPAAHETKGKTHFINDHTCTSCGNNRCSKVEKSCWLCGATIC